MTQRHFTELGDFLNQMLFKYNFTRREVETQLGLSRGMLGRAINNWQYLGERFMKIPEVMGFSPEDTLKFRQLCKENKPFDQYYVSRETGARLRFCKGDTQAALPQTVYALNPLGAFLKRMMHKYRLTHLLIETTLDLPKNFTYEITRRRQRAITAKFMKFPRAFLLTAEETSEFQELCEEYMWFFTNAHKPSPARRKSTSSKQQEQQHKPLLTITEEMVYTPFNLFTQVVYT